MFWFWFCVLGLGWWLMICRKIRLRRRLFRLWACWYVHLFILISIMISIKLKLDLDLTSTGRIPRHIPHNEFHNNMGSSLTAASFASKHELRRRARSPNDKFESAASEYRLLNTT